MKKKLRFPKGVTSIKFPTVPEIEGESIKAMRKVWNEHKLPKNCKLIFKRTISTKPNYGYDLTEVIVEK